MLGDVAIFSRNHNASTGGWRGSAFWNGDMQTAVGKEKVHAAVVECVPWKEGLMQYLRP